MSKVELAGPHPDNRRYEVVNVRTDEAFGNHTYSEAVTRARIMTANWNYKERFEVRVRK